MNTTPLTVLGEDEEIFRKTVREFSAQEITPRVADMDRDGAYAPEIIPKLFELGVMAIETPEKWGGADGTFFLATLAVEEISRADASVGVLVDVQNTLVANALLRWGSESLKQRVLSKMSSGTVASYALSEAGSGSDAFALQTRATLDGDVYVLSGRKLWITNAAEAGLFLVFANADPEAGYRGITCFVVEREFEGFEVGRKEDKLGIRASSTCELILEGVRVPRENVLGEMGKGYKVAIETLNEGRIGIGAQMVGVAQGALDDALSYTSERKQFGQPIGHFQSVQFELAQMATEIEAARLMVYNAARLKDAGESFVKQAAMAKLFSSQIAERVTSMAVELFGGVGYTRECPVEKRYRDAKIGKIYEGTSHMQLQTIARLLQRDA
ncbi:MAG: acyl-CoA dehydrogenase [Deltaproteobacteria bacterium]|nr:acyl-CoA dehydrogenase [Myxococcales bacterium]MCZ6569844.1 acyl-CoA dehydrogenase [Deltaproteobacteria bacterium]MCZ6713754.1 acyl-CoA dehydrogenase [Deltaproteobacteria bacterium]TDI98319.1 MAG: acyl-CoA dehydrogenase [Deltaproteobacteria bacterium]TDJ06291.1 MAG: acyl-CoA dehydrogenase [Deltaproteobacteria bacterium]